MTVTHPLLSERRLEDLAWLVNAEFQEMPGMRLTFAQAKRLWNLSTEECATVFEYLLNSGMLAKGEDDRFRRLESCLR